MSRLRRLYQWEYFWVGLFLMVTLVMHVSILNTPTAHILDEEHYVNDGKSIIEGNDTARLEHPPLGKLFIVAGMLVFGDTPLGWRFFPILFSTATIWLFYLICRQLEMSRNASSLATFLLAFENLTFIQGSVAMLDVFNLTFILLGFWLYLRDRYLLSGVAIALSGLAKLYGALAVPVIALHWWFTRRRTRHWRDIILLMLMTGLSFVLIMIPLDFMVGRHWVDPVTRIRTMLSLSSSLTFGTVTHDAATRPWEWLVRWPPAMMAYWYEPHYTAAISFTIWVLIIPVAIYMTYRAVKRDEAALFGISWFASLYVLWLPISLITDRVSFVFYFYPAVGAVCIGLGLAMSQLSAKLQDKTGKVRWLKLAIPVFLLGHLAVFVILTPVFLR